jgi:uridine phosphorylase
MITPGRTYNDIQYYLCVQRTVENMKSEIVVKDGKVLHLGLARGQLANNIFLVGDPARALLVAQRFDAITAEVRNREYVTLTGRYSGMPVSVIGTGIGVDNVEIAVVEAYTVHAFDFDSCQLEPGKAPLNFRRIGTSAGCQDDIEPGTLAISSYGLGLDNAGLYYDHPPADGLVSEIEQQAQQILTAATAAGARFRDRIFPYASKASGDIVAALADSATRLEIAHVTGITASTPGFYGPSSRYIEGLTNTIAGIKTQLSALDVRGQRVVNMEMESSLLFHLAGHLGSRVGTICPVISKPTASTTILDYGASVENAISVALGAMLQLNGAANDR